MFNLSFTLSTQTPKSGLKDQISERIWNRLSEGQQQMLLDSEKKRESNTVEDDVRASPIVKEITRMQMPHTDSIGNTVVDIAVEYFLFFRVILKFTCTLYIQILVINIIVKILRACCLILRNRFD